MHRHENSFIPKQKSIFLPRTFLLDKNARYLINSLKYIYVASLAVLQSPDKFVTILSKTNHTNEIAGENMPTQGDSFNLPGKKGPSKKVVLNRLFSFLVARNEKGLDSKLFFKQQSRSLDKKTV